MWEQICRKLVKGFNLSGVINVFVPFNGPQKTYWCFSSAVQRSSRWFSLVAACCMLFKVEPQRGLTQCYENGLRHIVGKVRKTWLFWSTDLLRLEWDVGHWKLKKKKKDQFSTGLKFKVRELLVDWSLNRVLLLSVTAIMPFVLLFPDKLGVNLRGLCLDQCLLNPWNYSMARLLGTWENKCIFREWPSTCSNSTVLKWNGWVAWRDLVTHCPLNSDDCVMLLAWQCAREQKQEVRMSRACAPDSRECAATCSQCKHEILASNRSCDPCISTTWGHSQILLKQTSSVPRDTSGE